MKRGHAIASVAAACAIAVAAACGDDAGSGEGAAPPEGGAPPPPAATNAPPPPSADATTSPFGLDSRPSNATCKAPSRPPSASPVKFELLIPMSVFSGSTAMQQAPGDATHWFATQIEGHVARLTLGTNTTDIVADVAALTGIPIVLSGESGLLGLAFHPNFAANGKLYISWDGSDTSACGPPMPGHGACIMRSHVGVLTTTDGGASFTQYQELLSFDQTDAGNHKGGDIHFGPDGMLYFSFGDGGQGDDAYHNGQNPNGYFSKIHRIDVDHPAGGNPYGIPADNPFASGGGQPETYAFGFRNPYRFSFDRATGEMWVGDVGEAEYEEIDKVLLGGNYGWPCRQGLHDYIVAAPEAGPYLAVDPTRCPSMAGLLDPIAEYDHLPPNPSAASVIGGYVYRGKAIPSFVGTYVFADYSRAALGTVASDPISGQPKLTFLTGAPAQAWGSFAEDQDGELYALSLDGNIWKMIADTSGEPGVDTFPDRLSKTGCVEPADPKTPASGLVPYDVISPLWSDGANKRRWMAVPDSATVAIGDDGHLDFPIGTVLMKEFSVAGKRTETRLFVRHADGGWAGYSYEWLDDESDALLLPSSKTKTVGTQKWYYPSRSDCLRCHNAAPGFTLGPELRQLDGDFLYPTTSRVANQLATLEHIGLLGAPLPASIAALSDPLGAAALEVRARSYLHANCSICHRAGGTGATDMDLRFGTPFGDAGLCAAAPIHGDLGVDGGARIAPGAPAKSIVSLRVHAEPGAIRMPPLASNVVDTAGAGVIDSWITSLASCP